jgi:diguanylate cyclase (GGDEF)-like protein
MAVQERVSGDSSGGPAQPDLNVHDPAVMRQTERLLSGRTRDIRLTGKLVQAFRNRSWRQTAKIIRSWMVWVVVLDLLILALNLFLLPTAVAVAMIAPGAIIPPAAVAVFLAWGRRRPDAVLEVVLGAGMFLILLAVSLMGIAAGGEWYERYLNVMVFVAIVGITTFNVSMRLTLSIAVMALGLYLAFQLQNPLVEVRSTISAFLFLASGITATVVARRTITILAHKTFLLELRDKGRLGELADANARLERLSKIDPLTGVANRRWMTELLNLLWNDAPSAQRGIALLMCDVDEFKKLNDSLGHAAGDRCLVEVANIISSRIRRSVDQVARYGGEEFLVLLPKVTEAEAVAIAESIREGVAAAALPNPKSRVLPVVTISVGIAFSSSIAGGLTPEQMQSQADAALYFAKHSGRNRVALYDDTLTGGDTIPRFA